MNYFLSEFIKVRAICFSLIIQFLSKFSLLSLSRFSPKSENKRLCYSLFILEYSSCFYLVFWTWASYLLWIFLILLAISCILNLSCWRFDFTPSFLAVSFSYLSSKSYYLSLSFFFMSFYLSLCFNRKVYHWAWHFSNSACFISSTGLHLSSYSLIASFISLIFCWWIIWPLSILDSYS